MSARIDGLSYHLEREFGAKVPQCPRDQCRSLALTQLYERDSYRCHGCGFEISAQYVNWIPADERVRRPEEQPIQAPMPAKPPNGALTSDE